MSVDPGIDAVDANAFRRERGGEAGGRQHQRGVGGASRQMHGTRDLAAGADDVDDRSAAAGRHPRQHGGNRVDVAEVLRIHRRVPRGGIEIVRRVAARGAGRIDENVDGTQRALDFVGHARGVLRAHEVGDAHDRSVRHAFQPGQRGIEIRGAARHQRNPRAFARERLGAGKPDALARAGDGDDLAREAQVHGERYFGRKRFSRFAITAGQAFSK